MKRFFAILLWWSASACAFASDNPANFSNLAQSSTDLSVKYLGQLFGSVPGVLHGGGSGLMGQLFYVFNQGVMVVVSVWLVFNIFNIIVSSAMSHQGPSKHNFALIAFRMAIGLALLVPNSNTGYSAIQDLMMRVVVEGTKLADETWNYALDYLANGGVIYQPESSSSQLNSLSQLNDYMTGSSHQGIVGDLFQNEVCMFLSNDYNHKRKSFDITAKQGAQGSYTMISVPPEMTADGKYLKRGTGQVYFPGYGDSPKLLMRGSACGAIKVNQTYLPNGSTAEMQYRQAFAALNQMAMDIMPFAKAQARLITDENATLMSAEAGGAYLANAVLDYIHLMKPVAAHQATQAQGEHKKFIDYAKDHGWFDAGSFYWNLIRWNDALVNTGDPAVLTPTMQHWKVPDELYKQIMSVDNRLGGSNVEDIWGNAIHQLEQAITGEVSNNPNHEIEQVNAHFETGGADYNHVLSKVVAAMVTKFEHVMSGKNASYYDPMVFVQHIGRACLSMAGSIWSYTMNWAHDWAMVAGVCAATNPGSTLVNAIMSWAVPMWTMAATALFAAGFMLNFYVPLYPYLLFLFGAMGWLLYVIEAMVAMPLVCFGMTHPEGHDFLGRADQALMLGLSVFLRPALMVIGFLAGMILSYIAFSFINTVLGRVFISAFAAHPGGGTHEYPVVDAIWMTLNGGIHNAQGTHYTGSPFADFLLIPLLLVAYGMVMIEVVNQCFSAIHQVPDMILRWIGAPAQQDQTERYAQSIKGVMSNASQQGGRLGGEAVSGKAKENIALGQDVGSLVGGVGGAGVQAALET
ncbi:MAG: DotA/TraY family protein [Coxiellaceae bacterium]|nr:DotA/TraY family protein [Coxiellaceae bacterium]